MKGVPGEKDTLTAVRKAAAAERDPFEDLYPVAAAFRASVGATAVKSIREVF